MDLDGGRFLPHIFHLAHFHASNRRITADTVRGELRARMINPRRHWALPHNQWLYLSNNKTHGNKNNGWRETWMGKTLFSPSFTPSL